MGSIPIFATIKFNLNKNPMSKKKEYFGNLFEEHFGFDEPQDLPERLPKGLKKGNLEKRVELSSGLEISLNNLLNLD